MAAQVLDVLGVAAEPATKLVWDFPVFDREYHTLVHDALEERRVLDVRVYFEVAEQFRGGLECYLVELVVSKPLAELAK